MVRKVYLVGTGMGDAGTLTAAASEAIRESDVLVGAPRLLEPYEDRACPKVALVKTDDIVAALSESDAATASVLFSGDVGFYSGATALARRLAELGETDGPDGPGEIDVQAIPGISSLVYFCAKALVPWQDAHLVSAHGRACDPVAEVRRHAKTFFLTGGQRTARDVCAELVAAGLGEARVRVGERLSYEDERLTQGAAAELAQIDFDSLAVMLVENDYAPKHEAGQLEDAARTAAADTPQEEVAAPRLLIAAASSGSGKTTFSCGLMQALVNRGMRVQACKCGPDYIDPMFHREVIGAASRNLDLFFMNGNQVRELVATGARESDVTVIEGVMGYYDGIALSDEASAWDVARTIDAPTVLVVDGRGRARSIAAEVNGFVRFKNPSNIVGVVINRTTEGMYERLKDVIERDCGVTVFGYLPKLDATLESRHLGLVTAAEVDDLRGKLNGIARHVERCVDVDGLLGLARSAPALRYGPEAIPAPVLDAPTIAVARDDAFCFYYDDTLRLLERLGARLVYFSPLSDGRLPEGTGGLYLGGGYPELHAEKLSANKLLHGAIRAALGAGMPVIAECGGFMYLHERMEDDAGALWPMVGAIAGSSFKTGKLTRFGYVSLTARRDNLLCAAGESLPAHEFHYWDSNDPGGAFRAQKPQSTRGWDCAHADESRYAGYPHLCLHAVPEAAARFVRACAQWAKRGEAEVGA